MGFRIAATGLVVFLFFLLLTLAAEPTPRMRRLYLFFGVIMLIGMFMMPLGLLISIWS